MFTWCRVRCLYRPQAADGKDKLEDEKKIAIFLLSRQACHCASSRTSLTATFLGLKNNAHYSFHRQERSQRGAHEPCLPFMTQTCQLFGERIYFKGPQTLLDSAACRLSSALVLMGFQVSQKPPLRRARPGLTDVSTSSGSMGNYIR